MSDCELGQTAKDYRGSDGDDFTIASDSKTTLSVLKVRADEWRSRGNVMWLKMNH